MLLVLWCAFFFPVWLVCLRTHALCRHVPENVLHEVFSRIHSQVFFFYQTIRLFLIIATISLQPFSFLFRLSSCIFCSWLCIYSSISWEVFSLKRLTVLCTNSSISYTSDVKQSDLNCLKRCDFISNVFYIARNIFQFESNDWKSLEQPRYETKSGKLINQNKIKLFNRMLDWGHNTTRLQSLLLYSKQRWWNELRQFRQLDNCTSSKPPVIIVKLCEHSQCILCVAWIEWIECDVYNLHCTPF